MAVVQISRIQQRRGRKLAGTGFPQLASGEIGWAVDTQELYIGNGAVSEGAPYVGNTQILTEHVNILDFAEAYTYKHNDSIIQTGPTVNLPVARTIQERLDERVSVKSFGAKGNGIDDDTEALQRALDQLYLGPTKDYVTYRVVLYFEPGEYLISDELRIPPYAHLLGSGIDSTVIRLTGSGSSGAVMHFVDGNSTSGHYTAFASMQYFERPRYISIEGMTLENTSPDTVVFVDNTDDSYFKNVKFLGVFNNGEIPINNTRVKQAGVQLRSTSGVFRPESVHFYSCIFNKTGYGVYSGGDSNNIGFYDCKFYQLYDGLLLGGDVYGAINTKVSGCYFDLIDRFGIWIKLGYGNTTSNNKFINVGNENQGYSNATYPIVRYDTPNNQSINDYFERNSRIKDFNAFGKVPFEPNVKSSSMITDQTSYRRTLEVTLLTPVEFLRFPLFDSGTYLIDYVINKNSGGYAVRTGTIHITVNLLSNPPSYTIKDEFNYYGNPNVENIKFSVSLDDYNADAFIDTLIIRLYNPPGNGIGTMNYSYRMLSR